MSDEYQSSKKSEYQLPKDFEEMKANDGMDNFYTMGLYNYLIFW